MSWRSNETNHNGRERDKRKQEVYGVLEICILTVDGHLKIARDQETSMLETCWRMLVDT